MLRLPVCPYCHTVYDYKQVQKASKLKKMKCYHCNKFFGVNYKLTRCIFISIICLILIIINTLLISSSDNFNMDFVYIMAAINMIVILLSIPFFPFTVRFKMLDRKQRKFKKKE